MSDTDTTFVFDSETNSWLAQDTLSIPNRGINFGDGVFETMVYDGAQLRFMSEHQSRLFLGLATLGISKRHIDLQRVSDFLSHNFSGQKLRVRWTIFRSGHGRYTPLENESMQFLAIESFVPAPTTKATAGISEQVSLTFSPLSGCKTLNALPYVMAGLEKQRKGWDEIILLDHRGNVSEAGASSVFWKKNGMFYTPSLSCGCIAGVSREVIIQQITLAGHPFQEGEFRLEEMINSEKVWTSNVTGISYLESIDSSKFSTDPIPFLQEIFD
jgi:4-amino-4-deoxychorismate lyase